MEIRLKGEPETDKGRSLTVEYLGAKRKKLLGEKEERGEVPLQRSSFKPSFSVEGEEAAHGGSARGILRGPAKKLGRKVNLHKKLETNQQRESG